MEEEDRSQYPYKSFGDKLKSKRENHKIYKDIKQFAKATDIGLKSLYGYEQGRTFPPIDNFIKICQVLNVTPNYLLSEFIDIEELKDNEVVKLVNQLNEIRNNPEVKETMRKFINMVNIFLEDTIPPERGDAEQQANG